MPNGHFFEATGKMYGRKHSQTLSKERAIHATISIVLLFHRIHTSAEHMQGMIVPMRSEAVFGEGSGQDYRPPTLAIPHPLDAPIDASRLDVFVPAGRNHGGKWILTSRISLPSLMVENTNGS
jgi:hypothetical protein